MARLFGLLVLDMLLSAPVYADVWEFGRDGTVLRAPHGKEDLEVQASRQMPHNVSYDMSAGAKSPVMAVTMASRSTPPGADLLPTKPQSLNRAIYQPMAEGVAEVFAREPAVAAAGLSPEDFTRAFVALVDQESRFNPNAVSPKGARGLGQLMPETAAVLGVDAADPLDNLRGAARYFVDQLGTFGRMDLALAAYNAGPHRVTQYRGIPPYAETRTYVARISAAAGLEAAVPEAAREADAAMPGARETSLSQPRKGTVLEW